MSAYIEGCFCTRTTGAPVPELTKVDEFARSFSFHHLGLVDPDDREVILDYIGQSGFQEIPKTFFSLGNEPGVVDATSLWNESYESAHASLRGLALAPPAIGQIIKVPRSYYDDVSQTRLGAWLRGLDSLRGLDLVCAIAIFDGAIEASEVLPLETGRTTVMQLFARRWDDLPNALYLLLLDE